MTYLGRISRRCKSVENASPGEIWHFRTKFADHIKHHLCVSYDRHFLFMNSPGKCRKVVGNYFLDETSVRRLPRNSDGVSVVSCTTVVQQPDNVILTPDDFRGSLLPNEMLEIALHIEKHELIERASSRLWLPDLIEWATNWGGAR